jgi:aminoglycoside phosphotransferase (APT) family kinase protein
VTVLHEGEPVIDAALVRRLVDEQLPQWSALPVAELPATGTDHRLFRLGDDLLVRMPRVDWATGQSDLEARWLPVLAPHLPVAVPERLAVGGPAHGYPWSWSVCRWIPGRTPDRWSAADRRALAEPLGRFCAALRAVDPTGGPLAGVVGSRGVPLVERDAQTREAIAAVSDELDARALTAAWDAALAAPAYDGPPAWMHADLLAGNLLVDEVDGATSLVAVIDWGPMAVGDPAPDAATGWAFFDAGTRDLFRGTAGFDDATWARGRGWALSTAVIALPYYRATSPSIAANARATLAEVLADPG